VGVVDLCGVLGDEETRQAVNERWLYDPVIDGWAGAVRSD